MSVLWEAFGIDFLYRVTQCASIATLGLTFITMTGCQYVAEVITILWLCALCHHRDIQQRKPHVDIIATDRASIPNRCSKSMSSEVLLPILDESVAFLYRALLENNAVDDLSVCPLCLQVITSSVTVCADTSVGKRTYDAHFTMRSNPLGVGSHHRG